MGIFLAAIVLLVVAIMHMGAGGDGQYDKTRNLTYSHKGTYGTAGEDALQRQPRRLWRERLEKDARVLRQYDLAVRGAEKLAGYL